MGIRIYRRKQDIKSYGLYTCLPLGARVSQLRAFVQEMGLRKDARSSKQSKRGARCPYRDSVFPKTVVGRTSSAWAGPMMPPINAMSRQHMSSALKFAMGRGTLGLDVKHYSGLNIRLGGIPVAVQAKVSEPILQSGHGKALSVGRELYATDCAILGMKPLYEW